MKIFEKTRESGWGNRLNIIDENNVLVGYDYESSCCENFGYYFTKKKLEKLDEEVIEESTFDFSGYVFDTHYEESVSLDDKYDEGGAVSFKLTKTEQPDIYLVLYNHHNGYYSHGFDMTKDNEEIKSGSI